MRMGLIRNHYVGRTFIEPQQSIRHFGVRVKLNPVRSILEGKRVVLVDDSIVRGTTSRKIVRMVRSAGAREVHMRISCPPTISPCFYGVDTPRRSELIAATHTLEEIRKYLNADSVAYLSLDGLTGAVRGRQRATARRATRGCTRWRSRATRARYLQLALKLNPRPEDSIVDDQRSLTSTRTRSLRWWRSAVRLTAAFLSSCSPARRSSRTRELRPSPGRGA